MPQKKQEYCNKCNQITTQIKKTKEEWVCLCCESAKFRSPSANKVIKAKSQTKSRWNMRL